MILLRVLSNWVMLLTFTIDSSVEIQDSYFDERCLLRRALRASIRASGFHACFGPRLAFRASIQVREEFRTSSSKVFDCFGLRLWALARASGFPARFGWCHQHWLPADAWTGRGRAKATVILNFVGNGRWAEAEFRVNHTIITQFASLLYHYYLLLLRL